MGDIVEFKKREVKENDNDEFLFTMDVYRTASDGLHAFMRDINTEDGRSERERTRLHADYLDTAAFAVEDELWLADEPDSRGAIIATVRIYENSMVRVRVHSTMDLRSQPRKAWVSRRLKEAKDILMKLMSSPPHVVGIVQNSGHPGEDDLR